MVPESREAVGVSEALRILGGTTDGLYDVGRPSRHGGGGPVMGLNEDD